MHKLPLSADAPDSPSEKPAMTYEVRGPDPDGEWFVVLVDGEDETAIDEVFDCEAKAQAMADGLNAKSASQVET